MADPICIVKVTIRNKALYELLYDFSKRGFFKRREDFSFLCDVNSADENVSTLACSENSDCQISFWMHDGDTEHMPHTILDVISCLIYQFKNIFEIQDLMNSDLLSDLLGKRYVIDLAFESVTWKATYSYYREKNVFRTEDVFEYDRQNEKSEYTRHEYSWGLFGSDIEGVEIDTFGHSEYTDQLANSNYPEFTLKNKDKLFPEDDDIAFLSAKDLCVDEDFTDVEGFFDAEDLMDDDSDVEDVDTEEPGDEPQAVLESSKDPYSSVHGLFEEAPEDVKDDIPDEYRDDKEYVLSAVKSFGFLLYDASERLRNDKEVVLAAVRNYGDAYEYASEELRKDKEVFYAALSSSGHVLMFAPYEFCADRDVVLASVSRSGISLAFASYKLRNDKEVVLTALKQNPKAYDFASDDMKKDPDIIEAAKHSED